MHNKFDCRKNGHYASGLEREDRHPHVLGLGLFLCCLLVFVGCTRVEDEWTPYFPKVSDLHAKEVTSPMVLIQVGEPLPQDLRFAIPLPDGNWKKVKELPKLEGAEALACITAPQGPAQGLIEVYTMVPPQEVGSLDFLYYFMTLNGIELLKSRKTFTSGGQTAEALGIIPAPKGSSDAPIVMRAAVYRSGKRFFVVRCQAGKSEFQPLSRTFAAVIGFFSPQTLTAPALIGNWRTYCLSNLFCYTGPDQGWKSLPSTKGQFEDAFVLLSDKNDSGVLHVKAVEAPVGQATSPPDRIQVLAESLAGLGIKVVRKEPIHTFDHANLAAKFHGQLIHCKDNNDQPVDLMAVSGLTPRGAVLVWMITVTKDRDPWAWMANKRAFEVVCDNLK
jgi:hypothetical protein